MSVGELADQPRGTLRLSVIVAEGYDAGVRLGEMIDQDMHVVAAGGEQRLRALAVVGLGRLRSKGSRVGLRPPAA
jgi:hypothetical protein